MNITKSILKTVFFSVILFQTSIVFSQDDEDVKKDSTFFAFDKGNFFIEVGANFTSDVSKNSDEFIYYVIDEKDRNFNMKFGIGYMLKDGRSVSVGYRYKYRYINTLYETAILDTINYEEKSQSHIANVSYGLKKIVVPFKNCFYD